MDWKPISQDSKNEIDSYFKINKCDLSDFTFTNLFIWQFARDISYKILDGFLVVKTCYENDTPYIFTPFGNGDLKEAVRHLQNEFAQASHPLKIKSISENQKIALESALPDLKLVENRDRFDYIYSVNELIELKGRKFHGKKNHLNRFKELYNYIYEPINLQNIKELINTWREWFKKIEHKASESLKMEAIGIVNLLKNYEHLNIKGGLIKVNGKIAAFTLGEALNDDMVVIHTEKADTAFHGAYQIINQQFLENEWCCFKQVNREEDLGIEGLRKAKLSYNPIRLAKKYETVVQ